MADIEWRPTIPSEGSLVGIGDDDIRHQKRQIESALNESFNIGETVNPMKPGAALPMYQAVSKLSYLDADYWRLGGQVFISSDESRMYSFNTLLYFGTPSTTTGMIGLLGTTKLVENADKTWPRATWVERSDWTTVGAAGDEGEYTIGYDMRRAYGAQGYQSGYDGIPTVFASVQGIGAPNPQPHLVQITSIEADQFKFRLQRNDEDTASTCTVYWSSLGTVAGTIGGSD